MNHTGSRWAVTIPAILLLATLAIFLRNSDITAPSRLLPKCSFHVLTGWHCPGCGNTRAAHAILHGDAAGAIRQNAVFVIGLPFLLFWAFRSWMGWVYPGRLGALPFRWHPGYTYTIVAVVVVFGVIRNIPVAPFTWLAPVPPLLREIPASEALASPNQEFPPPGER